MADETETDKKDDKAATTPREGHVVSVRQVVSRIITGVEQAERRGDPVDPAVLHPNAPKPQQSLDRRTHVVQLKRKHASQAKTKPGGMSDIKI